MVNLSDVFNINKGDVVSIVGSGGKTTLMLKLAHELKERYKVLVTTSTKIYMPIGDYEIYTKIDGFKKSLNKDKKNIVVIAKDLDEENNKLIGIDNDDLNILKKLFDIILIEADGSRGLPLKGWKEHEPVILDATNKTIGVIPSNLICKSINPSLVYNFDEFNILIKNSNYLNFESVKEICTNKNGIFKSSKGYQYLFLNKADTEEDIKNSKKLFAYLKEFNYNFQLRYGSLKKEEYYES